MASFEDDNDIFPEELGTAREAIFEKFLNEAEEVRQKRAQEIFDRVLPKIEEYLSSITDSLQTELNSVNSILESHSESTTESFSGTYERIDELQEKLEKLETVGEEVDKQLKSLTKGLDGQKTDLMSQLKEKFESAKALASHGVSLANSVKKKLPEIEKEVERAHERIDNIPKPYNDKAVKDDIDALRRRLNIARLFGSGNMNRNILIANNPSVLSRYTDVNLKAGNNVTITYTNNDTLKTTDVTLTATGGGGTVRSVNSINTSQTGGSASGTDYVYICSAGIQLTMPAPAANTNLYTVKNTSTSSILVSPNASETIDGSSNLILATQYTSVDLISDGTNWEIT